MTPRIGPTLRAYGLETALCGGFPPCLPCSRELPLEPRLSPARRPSSTSAGPGPNIHEGSARAEGPRALLPLQGLELTLQEPRVCRQVLYLEV